MKQVRVYLAGPVTGHSSDEISSWRDWIRKQCPKLEFVDPTLATYDSLDAYIHNETPTQALHRLSHGKLVVDRSKLLIKNCDLVFANFMGATSRVSIGAVGELFLADAFGKPILIVRERTGNIHDHAMINAIASQICYSIEDSKKALLSLSGQRLRIA